MVVALAAVVGYHNGKRHRDDPTPASDPIDQLDDSDDATNGQN